MRVVFYMRREGKECPMNWKNWHNTLFGYICRFNHSAARKTVYGGSRLASSAGHPTKSFFFFFFFFFFREGKRKKKNSQTKKENLHCKHYVKQKKKKTCNQKCVAERIFETGVKTRNHCEVTFGYLRVPSVNIVNVCWSKLNNAR